jgi:hypothetical protein
MSTEITSSSTVICSYLNTHTARPSYWGFLLSCRSEILSVTCASPFLPLTDLANHWYTRFTSEALSLLDATSFHILNEKVRILFCKEKITSDRSQSSG